MSTQETYTQTKFSFLEILEEVKLSYKPTIRASERPIITSSQSIYNLVSGTWEGMDYYETFKVLFLNRINKVLGIKTISTGGISGTIADPRLIFQSALLMNACAIVLMHNHPSGNTKASEPDISITKKLKEAGRFLDIPVIDHIILTSEGYYSFADEGIL